MLKKHSCSLFDTICIPNGSFCTSFIYKVMLWIFSSFLASILRVHVYGIGGRIEGNNSDINSNKKPYMIAQSAQRIFLGYFCFISVGYLGLFMICGKNSAMKMCKGACFCNII